MYEQGYIIAPQDERALSDDLGLERGYRYERSASAYFFNYVEAELIERYGVETVRQGGLKVYTTIDPRLQAGGRRQAIGAAPGRRARRRRSSRPTSTPARSSRWPPRAPTPTSQFNLAAQGHRQPGSSFKPFVLAAAVDQGIDPD